jgi:SPP1 family predicted phage head-tail adaptor
MAKPFSAAQLDTRVEILTSTSAPDAAGQPVETWAVLKPVWANVLYPSGIESVRAGAEASTLRASVRIRYRRNITTAMRVRLREGDFEIKAALPKGNEWLDLVCELTQ